MAEIMRLPGSAKTAEQKKQEDIMAKKNATNTRGKIVNAAWKLFYEQGYEDTTVEEIIDLSGTSKGPFTTILTVRMRFFPP